MESSYNTVMYNDTQKQQTNYVLPTVALYLGIWTVFVGAFSYSYIKNRSQTNLFTSTIDKCIGFFYNKPTEHDKLMNQIKHFNKNSLHNILIKSWDITESEDEINVTESDEEYLKRSNDLPIQLNNESDDDVNGLNKNTEDSKENTEKEEIFEDKPNRIEAILNQIIENTSNILKKKEDNTKKNINNLDDSEKIKKPDVEIGKEIDMVNYKDLGYDIIDSE
jgi:hypothetical protein